MIRLEVGQRVGRYEVLRSLDAGPGVAVYVAREPGRMGRVALKAAERPLSAELVERWAALTHPNLVGLRERVETERGVLLAMEFVEGPTLADWLLLEAPSLEDALVVFGGVAAGVAALHAVGLVHRDLKPQNVLMTRGWPLPVPRVADPGLAACVGDAPEGSLGTPGWMAPEQGRVPADPRVDVFSLGALLQRLCEAVGARASDEDQARAEALRGLIQRCLSTDPAARFADAGELLAAWSAAGLQGEKGS